eukprot:13509105-Alexandrium_andersonii.AAC.1
MSCTPRASPEEETPPLAPQTAWNMRTFCQSKASLGNTCRMLSSRHVQQLSRTRTTRLVAVGFA